MSKVSYNGLEVIAKLKKTSKEGAREYVSQIRSLCVQSLPVQCIALACEAYACKPHSRSDIALRASRLAGYTVANLLPHALSGLRLEPLDDTPRARNGEKLSEWYESIAFMQESLGMTVQKAESYLNGIQAQTPEHIPSMFIALAAVELANRPHTDTDVIALALGRIPSRDAPILAAPCNGPNPSESHGTPAWRDMSPEQKKALNQSLTPWGDWTTD